jgi:glycosyltransferase involved in cell wall biosynthesis
LLPDPVGTAWRRQQRSGPPDGVVNVTTTARLYVTKGLTYLLQAIARVIVTHPRARFRIYGDGPLRDELHAEARGLGLDVDAIFAGAYADRKALTEIMAGTDVFVMPSLLEGQPLGLVEAMAYGCPIVTTPVGGIPELIEDGVNGLLCPPGDPDALAARIRALIDDPGLRERLGREARRSYERGPFEPREAAGHIQSVYSAALRDETID